MSHGFLPGSKGFHVRFSHAKQPSSLSQGSMYNVEDGDDSDSEEPSGNPCDLEQERSNR